MSFNNQITYTPANSSTTGYAASVTGATFTLTNFSSGDGVARKVSILNNTVTDHSAKTLTIIGLNAENKTITEVLSAPGASATVVSVNYYLSIVSITPSATIGADTFSIGWGSLFVCPCIPCNWRGGQASIDVTVTGTITYSVEQTWDDIQTKTTAFVWVVNNAGEGAQTAKLQIVLAVLPKAYRLNIASYTNGATITLSFIQRDK